MAMLVRGYDWLINDLGDPRVQHWAFMSTPFPVLFIVCAYLYVVYDAGPKFMKHRKPFDLKRILIWYNLGQIIGNSLLFYYVLTSGWTTTYTLGCQPIDYSNDPMAVRMAETCWWTFILKMIDLVETVFFVMRKKQNQISALHVYHHVSVFLLGWTGVKYVAGGMATFSIMINCLIHVIMYSYYLASLAGPTLQKKLIAYKKSITIMQMVQFCIIAIHAVQALAPSCNVPKFLACLYIPNVFLFFYLFYDFYNKAYTPAVKGHKSNGHANGHTKKVK